MKICFSKKKIIKISDLEYLKLANLEEISQCFSITNNFDLMVYIGKDLKPQSYVEAYKDTICVNLTQEDYLKLASKEHLKEGLLIDSFYIQKDFKKTAS